MASAQSRMWNSNRATRSLCRERTTDLIRGFLRAAFLIILVPMGLWAQAGGTVESGTQAPAPARNGGVPAVLSVSDSVPPNGLGLGMGIETIYDDNVFSTNQARRGDLLFHVTPQFDLREERRHVSLALDYYPDLLVYREVKGLDTFNHGLQVESTFRVSQHFSLKLTEMLSYRMGIYQSPPSEEITPVPGPSTSPNPTVFTPLARQLDNNARVDVVYRKSARTSLAWFGGIHLQNFSHIATSGDILQNNQDARAGLEYHYRADRHDTVGAIYLLDDLSSQLGQRAIIHTALISFDRQMSRTVKLGVFGGPELVSLSDQLSFGPLPLTNTISTASRRPNWSLGAALIKRGKNSVFQISTSHQAALGGGLLGPVTSSSVSLNVSRRLMGRWNATGSFAYSDSKALGGTLNGTHIRGASASVGAEHQLVRNCTARFSYTYTNQRSNNPTLLFAGLTENRISLGIFYRYRPISPGR